MRNLYSTRSGSEPNSGIGGTGTLPMQDIPTKNIKIVIRICGGFLLYYIHLPLNQTVRSALS
jgi:hypothetical protein